MPHHIIAKIDPKPGSASALRDAMNALVAPSRAEAGCRRYDAFQSQTGQVIVVETWDDEAALALHGETDHIKIFREKIAGLVAGPVVIEVLQPIAP